MADVLVDQELVDAGLALLRADSRLVVWPDPAGARPETPDPPYVMVWAAVEWPPGMPEGSLAARSVVAHTRWWCHCVGATPEAAAVVAARVRAALLDARPTVTGRSCGQIWQEASRPPSRDTSTGIEVTDITAVYRMDSTG